MEPNTSGGSRRIRGDALNLWRRVKPVHIRLREGEAKRIGSILVEKRNGKIRIYEVAEG